MIRGINSPTNERPAGLGEFAPVRVAVIRPVDGSRQERAEPDIAKFIDDGALQSGQLLDDLPCVSLSLLSDQSIDQIDGITE